MILSLLLALQLGAPLLTGQESLPTSESALERLGAVLTGTDRALAALRECERELGTAPRAALPFLLRVTEAPGASESEQTRRLATLRGEVVALLAELDELGTTLATPPTKHEAAQGSAPAPAPISALATPALSHTEQAHTEQTHTEQARTGRAEAPYTSSDPLRHGIACFRAGRYDDACRLLAPLDEARAHYWRARALERLERYEEAIQAMERAVALDDEGFERRRAETDLELLRWKRDFAQRDLPQNVPGATHAAEPGERRPR